MSLRLRLLLVLGVSLSVLWTAVGAWMFMDARKSVREALDTHLAASANMVAGLLSQFPEPGAIMSRNSQRALDVVIYDGVACEVSLLHNDMQRETVARTEGGPDLNQAPPGFGNHDDGNKRWRTYVLKQGNMQIATADSIEIRERLVKELVLSAGLPFLVALLGSLLMLWFGIAHGLKPLERIRNLLAQRLPGDDSPLPRVQAPSELQPLLQTIGQLLERLQGAILRERRFTDSAAHELRTPLTGIKTHIQVAALACQRPGENETLKTALIKAEQGVLQLQGILGRLLKLARLEDEPADAESCEPQDAVYAATESLQSLHADIESRVIIKADDNLPLVPLPRPLLLSAVQNLIDNALRHAPSGKPVVVQLGWQGNKMLRISVFDEGPGLSEEERVQAVNRFWRKNPAVPGHGLGLSIVNAIARRHDGSFELLAGTGTGLEARLTLPVLEVK